MLCFLAFGRVWPVHACGGELGGLRHADVQHPVRRRAGAVLAGRNPADPLWLRARQQPEIAATAVGALEVVDALEATVGELPPQGEPSTRLPPGRARVDDDGVEAADRKSTRLNSSH